MQASAPTPNRRTYVQFGAGEVRVSIPEWRYSRTGEQMGLGQVQGADPSHGVMRLPGGVWSLRILPPHEMIRESDQSAFLGAANAILAAGIEEIPLFAQTFYTGLEMGVDVVTSGAPSLVKTVAYDATTWVSNLAADAAAVASPVLDDLFVAADRIMVSQESFPENCGFGMQFFAPNDPHGQGPVCTLLFGGPTAVLPVDANGGHFALRLLADGTAVLWERDTAPDPPVWREAARMEWAHGKPPEVLHWAFVIPYTRDRIALLTAATVPHLSYGPNLLPLLATSAISALLRPEVRRGLYQEVAEESGHFHTSYMTGPGVVRLDINRDNRLPLTLFRVRYDPDGVLNDGAFLLPHPVPAGTPLTLSTEANTPTNTVLAAAIHDATTHAVLSTDTDGNFLTNDGQSAYYVSVSFDSTAANQFSSPLLLGYSVSHPATYRTQVATPTLGGILEAVSVTGPDLTPDHETASVKINDPLGVLTEALTHDRSRCFITVDLGSGVISHLFEGELAVPGGMQKGTVGKATFPSENWIEYPNLRFVGLARRMMDGHVWTNESFWADPAAPVDPVTNQPEPLTWKVTDIIRYCLRKAGAPSDEIAIPDFAVRLFPSDNPTQDDYSMLPGTESGYFRLAMKLANEYLGAILLHDPNAGTRGLWRLVFLPQPPYVGLSNFLATFVLARPGGSAGKLGTHPGVYGTGVTWIERDSYRQYYRAPEMNVVIVQGVSKNGEMLSQTMRNEDSISTLGHPDYVGGILQYVRPVDAGLPSQAAVDWLTRRIFDVAAHAQRWCSFTAPLLLGMDPLDPFQVNPRPLRIGDLVYVGERPALVRNNNPDISQTDKFQKSFLECLFLD